LDISDGSDETGANTDNSTSLNTIFPVTLQIIGLANDAIIFFKPSFSRNGIPLCIYICHSINKMKAK